MSGFRQCVILAGSLRSQSSSLGPSSLSDLPVKDARSSVEAIHSGVEAVRDSRELSASVPDTCGDHFRYELFAFSTFRIPRGLILDIRDCFIRRNATCVIVAEDRFTRRQAKHETPIVPNKRFCIPNKRFCKHINFRGNTLS